MDLLTDDELRFIDQSLSSSVEADEHQFNFAALAKRLYSFDLPTISDTINRAKSLDLKELEATLLAYLDRLS